MLNNKTVMTALLLKLLNNKGMDMFRKLFSSIMLCSISLLFAGYVCAAESIKLLTANTPLFSEFDDEGNVQGYSIDFASSLLDLAGIKADITPLPFARLVRELQRGQLMMATGIGRIKQREDHYFWIAPLTATDINLYGKTLKIPNSQQRSGTSKTSVAVMRGDYRAELVKENPQFVLHEYNSWAQAINAVIKERVDAVFFSDTGIRIYCQRNKLDCSQIRKLVHADTVYSYLVMPKTEDNQELAMTLKESLSTFLQSSRYLAIKQRWQPMLENHLSGVWLSNGVIKFGEISNEHYHLAGSSQ